MDKMTNLVICWLGKLKVWNAYINPIIYFSRKIYTEKEAEQLLVTSKIVKTKKEAKKFLKNCIKKSDNCNWYHLPKRLDLVFVLEKSNGKFTGSIQSLE